MTKRSLHLYAKDILDSIEKIEEFIKGMDFDEFQSDDKTSSRLSEKTPTPGGRGDLAPTLTNKNIANSSKCTRWVPTINSEYDLKDSMVPGNICVRGPDILSN